MTTKQILLKKSKQDNIQTHFVSYVNKQKKWCLLALINIVIFLFVFYVYNLPLEPIVYSATISGLVAVIFILLDFMSYHKKCTQINHVFNTIAFELQSFLEPEDFIEERYQDLVSKIYQMSSAKQTLTEQNRIETMEYYTMWVHQIKTPLAAIRLLLQLDETSKRTEILSELCKVEQYVDMALQYLRIDDMSSDLLFKEFDLFKLIRQVLRKHASWFISKNITIQLSEQSCIVLSDEKWLSVVLEQLISNALKYTNQGGMIAIYLDENQPNTLIIEDNGIGIAEEDLPRIYEKGFTGRNGRIDQKATGIGLYLVKRILSKLSHTINITSVIHTGTKVFLHFHREQFVVE